MEVPGHVKLCSISICSFQQARPSLQALDLHWETAESLGDEWGGLLLEVRQWPEVWEFGALSSILTTFCVNLGQSFSLPGAYFPLLAVLCLLLGFL